MWRFLIAVLLVSSALIAAEADKSLIIVTTELIKNSSSKLPEFIAEKEKRGFKVLVGTEKEYGGAGVKGQEKAVLIRDWLKTVYTEKAFLLLIGYPHNEYGDVPMVKFWSRRGVVDFPGMSEWADTDFFYADMTGNWDLNKNSYFGEQDDWAQGGVDFSAGLRVGRMPVYFNDISMVDAMLQHSIDYMRQTNEFAEYRKKFFMPAAIFGFAGMPFSGGTWPFDEDGATHMEWYFTNYLSKHPEISVTRMYEAQGFQPTAHKYDIPLNMENMIDEWNRGYGMVLWAGHGESSQIMRMVWDNDNNGNKNPDEGEVLNLVMFDYKAAQKLSGKYPSFVVAMSCDVGQSQMPSNLATHLLISGGAVGILASSVIGPRSLIYWHEMDGKLDTETFGDDNVGPLFFNGLIAGDPAGTVAADMKKNAGTAGDIETMTGKASFNYFGDPTLTLYQTAVAETIDDKTANDAESTDDSAASDKGCSVIVI